MKTIDAREVAMEAAMRNGTLRVEQCYNERLGNLYFAVSDDVGLIKIVDEAEALALQAEVSPDLFDDSGYENLYEPGSENLY